jgi:two-component system, chemotaxis family, chemotaxis protein CheY
MLTTLLQTHPDWQVCAEAANGVEAVQKAAELKPDVVILDLAMPEMDGLHAAREILSNTPEVPILLHTNHAFSSLALEAKKNGIREVINKGTSMQELISAVESLLKQGAARPGDSDGIDHGVDSERRPDVSNLPEVKLAEADKLLDQEQQNSKKAGASD